MIEAERRVSPGEIADWVISGVDADPAAASLRAQEERLELVTAAILRNAGASHERGSGLVWVKAKEVRTAALMRLRNLSDEVAIGYVPDVLDETDFTRFAVEELGYRKQTVGMARNYLYQYFRERRFTNGYFYDRLEAEETYPNFPVNDIAQYLMHIQAQITERGHDYHWHGGKRYGKGMHSLIARVVAFARPEQDETFEHRGNSWLRERLLIEADLAS